MKITGKKLGHAQKPKKSAAETLQSAAETSIAQNGPLERAEAPRTSTHSGAAVKAPQTSACLAGGVLTGSPGDVMAGPLALSEVRDFPAALLADLPRGFALRCRAVAPDGAECEFVVVTSRARYAAARDAKIPAFVGSEWRAMAVAVASERARSRQLAAWIERKRAAASWNLTRAGALDGVPEGNAAPMAGTVGGVLHALGAELLSVECAA